MAYACPICSEPQVDAAHLANHVAFTAIGGDDAHEAWLDTHAPEWGQHGQDELAEIVVEHAEETDFPVDVDAGEPPHSHDHEHASGPQSSPSPGDLDEDARDVLAEARELTRKMQSDDAEADDRADSETQ